MFQTTITTTCACGSLCKEIVKRTYTTFDETLYRVPKSASQQARFLEYLAPFDLTSAKHANSMCGVCRTQTSITIEKPDYLPEILVLDLPAQPKDLLFTSRTPRHMLLFNRSDMKDRIFLYKRLGHIEAENMNHYRADVTGKKLISDASVLDREKGDVLQRGYQLSQVFYKRETQVKLESKSHEANTELWMAYFKDQDGNKMSVCSLRANHVHAFECLASMDMALTLKHLENISSLEFPNNMLPGTPAQAVSGLTLAQPDKYDRSITPGIDKNFFLLHLGVHFFVLLFQKGDSNTYDRFGFDSLSITQVPTAQQEVLISKTTKWIEQKGIQVRESSKPLGVFNETSQQQDAVNCGPFSLLFIEHLVFSNSKVTTGTTVHIDPMDILETRTYILNLMKLTSSLGDQGLYNEDAAVCLLQFSLRRLLKKYSTEIFQTN